MPHFYCEEHNLTIINGVRKKYYPTTSHCAHVLKTTRINSISFLDGILAPHQEFANLILIDNKKNGWRYSGCVYRKLLTSDSGGRDDKAHRARKLLLLVDSSVQVQSTLGFADRLV